MAGHAGSMPPRFVHRPARCPDDRELGPGRVKIGWVPCRCAPVAMAVACVLVVAVQAVWLRHGMETGWVDAAVDAKVVASLGGHPMLLATLVWPGEPVPAAAMAAALVLACILRRRYGQAALVAISVPLATALTEVVLKPLIGQTSWGNPFPSGHVTRVAALATALAVLPCQDARDSATPAAPCPCRHGIPDSGRRRLRGNRREYASLLRHGWRGRRRHRDSSCDRAHPRPAHRAAFPIPGPAAGPLPSVTR